ncbi:cyclic nucleotide-binding domain-containing protein [Pusillimonas sp. TS35]|uniref:Crp/Fnr family transcriptional regulator n=1 Tax=Paracandidimonas lactea TaxID=2895524 RepID=UPI00136A9720|nr:Crp/Fnr family transcriptional regulator [Paracandidimonas lactea]MYN14838.1 cyclic nucleotide-binding domain-containing protein [Pusillimonas sp. TS35]
MPTPDAALVQHLATSPVFSRADRNALAHLAYEARLVSVANGAHLFEMGMPANHFYVVQSGRVSLYRPCYNGETKIFRVMESGDVVGEASMFLEPARYPLSARATAATKAYCVERKRLLSLARTSPAFSYALTLGLATGFNHWLNRVDLLTIGNAGQRLVTFLMDLYIQQHSTTLVLPSSQGILARQLNIAAETFSRQMNQFKRAGLITLQPQRQLILLDVPGLCRFVGIPAPPSSDDPREPASTGNTPHPTAQPGCTHHPLGKLHI